MRDPETVALRERLLRAGIAPRHAQRLATEWNSHLAALAEEARALDQPPQAAREHAQRQLGTPESLVAKAIEQPALMSWGARRPGLVFGLAPAFGFLISFIGLLFSLFPIWEFSGLSEPMPHGPSSAARLGVELLRLFLHYGFPLIWAFCWPVTPWNGGSLRFGRCSALL